MTTSLKIDEFKKELKDLILNNRRLQENRVVPIAIGARGHSGIGKTSAILQVALDKEVGIDPNNVVRINLAEVEELGDLVGIPLKEFEVCKDGGDCQWINEHLIESFIKGGYTFTGGKRMSYAEPSKVQGKGENGILILDDYTRADPRFLNACMTLIETQSYYSWKLPKGWTIVLSTNPDDGNYQVSSLDSAQASRFVSYDIIFAKEPWAKWAEEQSIDGRFINFVLLNPELLEGTGTKDDKKQANKAINPRAAVMFSHLISGIKDWSTSEGLETIQRRGEASVGPEFAQQFVMFINNQLDKLPSPEYMLNNKWEDVKSEIRSVVGVTGGSKPYRADIASVLALRIINYSVNYAETNTIEKKLTDRLVELVTEDIFVGDLNYAIVREIFNGNKQKFKQLTLTKKVADMIMS